MADFDPTDISQQQLQDLRTAAEHSWGDDTRAPDYVGHPQPSAGQCYVTSRWLQNKLGGHVGTKEGHYFWVSPDREWVIDLTGDQNSYEPTDPRVAGMPLDEEDEPWSLDEEHGKYRPGPVFYTRSSHPLYKDFRIKNDPQPGQDKRDWEDIEHPDSPVTNRATLFAKRANHALAGKLRKRADAGGAGGLMGDAFPGEEPQAMEDFKQRYFHDTLSDLQLSLETPDAKKYHWFYGNGQLHVSPFHDHGELRDHAGTPANHSGPVAAGFVQVEGGSATWSAQSNVALRGLKRVLEDYGKAVGWKWGGLVGADGQPTLDDFGPKKSYWVRWKDGVEISERPIQEALRVDVRGRTAHVARIPYEAREGLTEWAHDFGFRLAEYPGGTDMTDRIKNKEWPMQFDKGNPDKGEAEPAFEGEPQGELTCPYCKEIQPDFKAFVLHVDGHKPQDSEEILDGGFPTIDPDVPLQMRPRNSEPTAQPLASVREASTVPDWSDYADFWGLDEHYRYYGGYYGGQLVGYGAVDTADDGNIVLVHSAVPDRGIEEAITRRILLHYPRATVASSEPLTHLGMIEIDQGLWKAGAGQEGKDLIQAAVPFIFDVEQDHITTGHPGMRTSDIMGQFTPGGIVEGYYEPGGKIKITTTTTVPYSVRHMLELWYWNHPTLEITGVEMETAQGKPQKLAAQNVGQHVRTLAATDPAVWTAYQALRAAGGRVYAVGGAVRDALLGKESKDIDLLVRGLPTEAVQHTLSTLPGRTDLRGSRFGIFVYATKGAEVDIALPRTDDYGSGGRRGQGNITADPNLPLERDLERRDFTANSMAVGLDNGELVDPFGGAGDIEKRTLRTTHPNSFKEDPTRLVRALTANSRFGLVPDEQTRKEMAQAAHYLDHESPDALKQQLDKLLVSDNPAGAIRLAQETGVLKHLFPELAENFDFDQKNPHHDFTLGEHSLNVLENMASKTKDPDLRLTALLHDIGKPASAWSGPDGVNHYHPDKLNGQPVGADHAAVGANMAEARLRQTYNFPVNRIRRVYNLIDQHMWGDFESPKGARRFLHKQGDAADDLMTLRDADREGHLDATNPSEEALLEHQRALIEQARTEGAPTSQSALSINGNDLQQMGLRPGPQIGTILRQLTNDVVAEPELNEPNAIRQRAQEYIDAQPS